MEASFVVFLFFYFRFYEKSKYFIWIIYPTEDLKIAPMGCSTTEGGNEEHTEGREIKILYIYIYLYNIIHNFLKLFFFFLLLLQLYCSTNLFFFSFPLEFCVFFLFFFNSHHLLLFRTGSEEQHHHYQLDQ